MKNVSTTPWTWSNLLTKFCFFALTFFFFFFCIDVFCISCFFPIYLANDDNLCVRRQMIEGDLDPLTVGSKRSNVLSIQGISVRNQGALMGSAPSVKNGRGQFLPHTQCYQIIQEGNEQKAWVIMIFCISSQLTCYVLPYQGLKSKKIVRREPNKGGAPLR